MKTTKAQMDQLVKLPITDRGENVMTHELDTLSSLAEKIDDSGSLNLDCLGSNPNMSYCAFENTSSAVQQLTDGIETAMEAIGINASTDRTGLQNDLILHALDLGRSGGGRYRTEKEAWMRLAEQASALADLLASINPLYNFPTLTAAEAISARKIEAQAEALAARKIKARADFDQWNEARKKLDADENASS